MGGVLRVVDLYPVFPVEVVGSELYVAEQTSIGHLPGVEAFMVLQHGLPVKPYATKITAEALFIPAADCRMLFHVPRRSKRLPAILTGNPNSRVILHMILKVRFPRSKE